LLTKVPIPWAVIPAAGLAAITVDISQLCNTDPPADPGITSTDWLNMQNPADFINYIASAAKFYQLFKRYLWWQACECVTTPTPQSPTPPSAPANLPAINPWGGSIVGATCWDASATTHPKTDGTYTNFLDWLPPITQSSDIGSGNRQSGALGWKRVVWTNKWNTDGTHWTTGYAQIAWYNAGGTIDRTDVANNVAMGATSILDVIPPSTSTQALFFLGGNFPRVGADSVVTASVTTHLQVACVGEVIGGVPAPCCPPDPILSGQLTQLMGMVTLIQRQLAPFAYVPGAAHAGLSGSGHFAVQGLLGAKVTFTTLPDALGQSGNLPVEIFDAGYLTWNTPDGYPQSVRLDHNPYLSLPARCSVFTDLAYDLHASIVATITELKREP
jgi:hypothetical protein